MEWRNGVSLHNEPQADNRAWCASKTNACDCVWDCVREKGKHRSKLSFLWLIWFEWRRHHNVSTLNRHRERNIWCCYFCYQTFTCFHVLFMFLFAHFFFSAKFYLQKENSCRQMIRELKNFILKKIKEIPYSKCPKHTASMWCHWIVIFMFISVKLCE